MITGISKALLEGNGYSLIEINNDGYMPFKIVLWEQILYSRNMHNPASFFKG